MFQDSEKRISIRLLTLICIFIGTLLLINSVNVLPSGPIYSVSRVTISLWENLSIQPEYFKEVYREFSLKSKAENSRYWQDVFALGKNGELYPKHSLLSAILAVPFYAVFGNLGFLIIQQTFLYILIIAIYKIITYVQEKEYPMTTLFSCCILTQTLFYSYIFSYDLHAVALMIGGLAVSYAFPFVGSIILTTSIFVRPSNLILSFPLVFAWCLLKKRTPYSVYFRVISGIVGFSLVFLVYLYINYLLW